MKSLALLVVLTMCGCSAAPRHPALRTALIATGAAIVAGASQRDRDEPMRKSFEPVDCRHKDCR